MGRLALFLITFLIFLPLLFNLVNAKTCEPICRAIGTRSEGWYDSCTGELIKFDFCNGCEAVYRGNETYGAWYSSCNWELIKYYTSNLTPQEEIQTIQNCPDYCENGIFYSGGIFNKRTGECEYRYREACENGCDEGGCKEIEANLTCEERVREVIKETCLDRGISEEVCKERYNNLLKLECNVSSESGEVTNKSGTEESKELSCEERVKQVIERTCGSIEGVCRERYNNLVRYECRNETKEEKGLMECKELREKLMNITREITKNPSLKEELVNIKEEYNRKCISRIKPTETAINLCDSLNELQEKYKSLLEREGREDYSQYIREKRFLERMIQRARNECKKNETRENPCLMLASFIKLREEFEEKGDENKIREIEAKIESLKDRCLNRSLKDENIEDLSELEEVYNSKIIVVSEKLPVRNIEQYVREIEEEKKEKLISILKSSSKIEINYKSKILPRMRISKSIFLNNSEIGRKPVEILLKNREIEIEPGEKVTLKDMGFEAKSKIDLIYENGSISSGKSNKPIRILPSEVIDIAGEGGEIELFDDGTPKYKIIKKERIKLFGFLPLDSEKEYIIDAENGTILKVNEPWWSPFFKKKSASEDKEREYNENFEEAEKEEINVISGIKDLYPLENISKVLSNYNKSVYLLDLYKNTTNIKPTIYDYFINWSQKPMGYGMYISVSGSFKKGTLSGRVGIVANKGGVYISDFNLSNFKWVNIGPNIGNLYRYNIVDIEIDPFDKDHIYVLTPGDYSPWEHGDIMRLYESKDGGKTWKLLHTFLQKVSDDHSTSPNAYKARIEVLDKNFIFLYTYDGKNFAYYSEDGGQTWKESEWGSNLFEKLANWMVFKKNMEKPRFEDEQKLYFSQSGKYGILRPIREVLFRTDDYGRTWHLLLNLNETYPNHLVRTAFAISEDGQTIYVFAKIKENDKVKVYEHKSVDGGKTWQVKELKWGYRVQWALVDPNNPEHVSAFVYMKGLYYSRDGGQTWKNLFKYKFYDYYTGYLIKENSAPMPYVPPPVDIKEIEIVPYNIKPHPPLLLATDQGIFLFTYPVNDSFPSFLNNLGKNLENGEIYFVDVDECGNVYHGLWHNSVALRTPSGIYFHDGREAGSWVLNRKCGEDMLAFNINAQFGSYVSWYGNYLKEFKTNIGTINFNGIPQYSHGYFYFRDSNNELRRISEDDLKNGNKNIENLNLTHVRAIKTDLATGDLYVLSGNTHIFKVDSNGNLIHIFDSQFPITSGDYFNVYNGKIVAFSRNLHQLVIYDENTGDLDTHPLPLDNPYRIFIDPNCPTRFYLIVHKSMPQCPVSLYISFDNGENWEKLSSLLDCNTIWDIDFYPPENKIYLTSHGTGLWEGSTEKLTCQE